MRNKSAARVMSVEGYKTALLFASGLGIAVQAPYLKQLILGYISQEVHRIHVIWQFEDLDTGIACQSLLNDALIEDKRHILSISVYWRSGNIPESSFGKRATLYSGSAPLRQIIDKEVAGARRHHSQELQEDVGSGVDFLVEGELCSECLNALRERRRERESGHSRMLVTGGTWQQLYHSIINRRIVPASDGLREELQEIVQGFTMDKVSMAELDYQLTAIR